MFSGIIKHTGTVSQIITTGANKTFWIGSEMAKELHVDQSVAHNGVCLTVEETKDDTYRVTAINETLVKSNLGLLKIGDRLNLEQSITLQTLLDGHLVQGHVDTTGTCIEKTEQQGSWLFTFQYPYTFEGLVIEKGSIALNGVSLTAFNCIDNLFSVAIIPYTYSHTNFETLNTGDSINIEFDIVGKYIRKMVQK
jgi:riboflavin synthase